MKIEISEDYQKITMTADEGMILIEDMDELLKPLEMQIRAKKVTISADLPYWDEVPISVKSRNHGK